MLQKWNELSYKVLPHLPLFTWCLANQLPLLQASQQLFLQGKHFQKVAGNVFQEFIESWSMDFYATEINIFLTGKNVLILMVPILINKDVFKPSYNDLKIMVWNHNYFCINLINPLYFNRKKKINIVQKIMIINRIRSSATGPTEIWWIFYIHITSWSK